MEEKEQMNEKETWNPEFEWMRNAPALEHRFQESSDYNQGFIRGRKIASTQWEWHTRTEVVKAVKEERERIIKLLENAFISDGESLASAKLYDLIALIKGETNE